jgi:hypothetical protein
MKLLLMFPLLLVGCSDGDRKNNAKFLCGLDGEAYYAQTHYGNWYIHRMPPADKLCASVIGAK